MPRVPNSHPLRLVGLLGLLLLVAGAAWWLRRGRPTPAPTARPAASGNAAPSDSARSRQFLADLTALDAKERAVDETIWAPDLAAQRHARTIVRLWDELNLGTNDWATLAGFSVGGVRLPRFGEPTRLPHGIDRFPSAGNGRLLPPEDWRSWLAARAAEGWELRHVEFRHQRFDPATNGAPARSRFAFRALLRRPGQAGEPERRVALAGPLRVDWTGDPEAPEVGLADASRLELTERTGPPRFREVLHQTVSPPPKSFFIDPVVVRDLDRDGRPEVILAAANLVLREQAGAWVAGPLCRAGPGLIFTAVLGDFDGDGREDLLVARFGGLFLFNQLRDGVFEGAGRPVWAAQPRLRYAQVLTCGDVDADGDLDVWLGQYKNPYDGGQMPTPFYDANDGYPAWLLRNDGRGHFTDATEAAGLAEHRFRRAYSGSFVDLDGDADLDLLVVSDFAGVALYENDGRGRFQEVTSERIDEPKGFGMAHVVGDFNRDGLPDLLVTGMRCPTALRLDHLGLERPGFEAYARMRPRMTAGCRLYAGRRGGGFGLSPMIAPVADAGWAWGPAAFDVENDGFLDVCVPNGHETRQSAEDYEAEFWRHDIYVADSQESPLLAAWFAGKFSRTRGQGMSYGGWDVNRLWLNQAGRSFVEAGWLLGLAVTEDSRTAVAADLDVDGRQDLVVTTFETWPVEQQTVRIFRNETPEAGHWIAVRVRVPGARVTLRHDGRLDRRWLLTGDSHRAQGPPVAFFGLGAATNVASLEILLPGGRVERVDAPAVDRLHEVSGAGSARDVESARR